METIERLKVAHRVALDTYRECHLDNHAWRVLCDYETALARAGVVAEYDDEGGVTYDHDGDVSV